MIRRDNSRFAGFTRTELVFTILGVFIVTSLLTACASRVGRQNDLSRCKDNLKNIALSVLLWIEDNEVNHPPWRADHISIPSPDPQRSECWFHLSSLSNQLRSPKLLACPADTQARVASTWDNNPRSGIGAPEFRDRACSYAIGLDISGTGRMIPIDNYFNPMLFVDRHLGGTNAPQWCDFAKAGCTAFSKPFELWWTNQLHGSSFGNAAFIDGSVDTLSNRLERLVQFNIDFAYWPFEPAHLLFPKGR